MDDDAEGEYVVTITRGDGDRETTVKLASHINDDDVVIERGNIKKCRIFAARHSGKINSWRFRD